jgi:hypothetical protein
MLIHPSAWKVNSPNFAGTEFSEVRFPWGCAAHTALYLVIAGKGVLRISLVWNSQNFALSGSAKFAGTRNGATPHKKRAGRLVPALDVSF